MTRALVLLLALAAPLAAQETHESSAYGFSVRPPAGWACYSGDGQDGVLHQVAVYPRDSQGGLPSALIQVVKHDSAMTLAQVRDAAAAAFDAKRAGLAGELKRGTRQVAGREALTLHGTLTTQDGVAVQVECSYLLGDGFVYAVTLTRRADDAATGATLEALVASFTLKAADPRTARLRALADRCGSEVPWARTWAEAAARARREDRLVFVLFRFYSVVELPDTVPSGALMDPDLVALLQERFVVLRMSANDEAPFRAPERFGLSKHSWGQAAFIVTPDGEVKAHTGTLEASHLLMMLGQGSDKPQLAARILLGRILRDERGKGFDPGRAAQKGLLSLRLGGAAESEAEFLRVVREAKDHARAGEAMFWLGALAAATKGDLDGGGWWQRLVDERPDDRWAWKAAANLLRTGALVNGMEPLAWPSDAAYREALPPVGPPLGPTVQGAALEALVRSQRPDGSWGNPAEDLSLISVGYREAITAIAGTALLRFETQRIPLANAQRFVLRALQEGRLHKPTTYGVWAQTFALRFLVRCRRAGVGHEAEVRPAIARLVEALAQRQHASGGWPYISVQTDPQGGGLASSFLSAAILLTLLEAREHVVVPAETLERGATFLRGLRDEDGSFRYASDVKRKGAEAEAAGRSPLCALALHRLSPQGDVDGVRRALELFLRDRGGITSERGKDLCHTGLQGQASYYFFYDWLHAAEAVRVLPPDERARFREAIRADILAARGPDGSFVDMPSLGRAYGTAMALETLGALDD